MHTLKLRKVGNSLGVTLPKELLAHLSAQEGDDLYVTLHQGSLHITHADPEFEHQMEIYRSLKKRYHNASRELAR